MPKSPEFNQVGGMSGGLPSKESSLVEYDGKINNLGPIVSRIIERMTDAEREALRSLHPISPEQLEAIRSETPAEREAAAHRIAGEALDEVYPRRRRRR